MRPLGGRKHPPAQPRAVLFDLDGTLFDHEGAVLEALEGWLPTVGIEPSAVAVDRWFDEEEVYMAQWRAGQVSWQGQRRERLRAVLPDRALLGDAELDALFDTYLRRYESAWRAFDDVVPALDELAAAGLRLGVLTNGATSQQNAKVEALGFGGRSEFVVTGEDLGVAKPDPMSYLTACDRFALPASEVVHVGDLPGLDVAAPQAAGLRSVLIDRSGQHQRADALQSLSALASWIESLASFKPPQDESQFLSALLDMTCQASLTGWDVDERHGRTVAVPGCG